MNCIQRYCRSPTACGGFGYCRARNSLGGLPSTAQAAHWRREDADGKFRVWSEACGRAMTLRDLPYTDLKAFWTVSWEERWFSATYAREELIRRRMLPADA